jgi:hypothetical protein
VLNRGEPIALPDSLRWRPSAFRQRVIGVCHSGWSGLKSPQAVARRVEFLRSATEAEMAGGLKTHDADGAADAIDETSYIRSEAHASSFGE